MYEGLAIVIILSIADLGYTDLSTSVLSQRQSVEFRGSLSQLEHHLYQLSGDIETVKSGNKRGIRVFKAIDILLQDDVAVLEVNL